MKKNVGVIDKIIRIVLAAVSSFLYFTGVITGTAGTAVLIIGAILLVTAYLRFCPIYAFLGFRTCKMD